MATSDRELVMFATRDCLYCSLFDREVAPGYTWSIAARQAPLRRVDLLADGTGGYSLRSDISVMPTFVMFSRGREVGRIGGYPGKDNFYRLVDHLLQGEAKPAAATSGKPGADQPSVRR